MQQACPSYIYKTPYFGSAQKWLLKNILYVFESVFLVSDNRIRQNDTTSCKALSSWDCETSQLTTAVWNSQSTHSVSGIQTSLGNSIWLITY